MLKPTEIREMITRSNQYLRENPDKMQVFIDSGNIVCRGADSLSYEYQYKLNIIIQDFPDHADLIILPLLVYLRTNQPELFENISKSNNMIRFDVEFINQDVIDLSLEIDLTERVVVGKSEGDRLNAVHVSEPERDEFPNQDYVIDVYNRKTDEYLGTIFYPMWMPEY